MDADLKALHHAVNVLLKARREAKRAVRACRQAGSNQWGSNWEGQHYADQLAHYSEIAGSQAKQAETDVLTLWEALN